MGLPWYDYPIDSPGGGYQEMTDPMGNYLKPDTNIAIPSGTPITAWDSGTITSVVDRGRTLAGLSVTERLDNPPNAKAQYASFNYLGSSQVQVGQRVQAGQQIGTAGSPTGVNFALALGVSPIWGEQCPQCSSKQPQLDPRIIINSLRGGTGLPTTTPTTSLLGFDVGGITGMFTNLFEEIGIFLLALLIIVIGIMLLMGKQIKGFVETGAAKGAKAAETAALL